MTVLLGDERITRIPAIETGEPLIDLFPRGISTPRRPVRPGDLTSTPARIASRRECRAPANASDVAGMNDYGVTGATTGAEVLLKLPVDAVWAGITAIDRYGEWSPECYYGAWLDDADRPVAGARFEARNRFADGYETYVTCTVTIADEPLRFGWDVYGDEAAPFAHWEYALQPQGSATMVRQSFTHGPGDSGLRAGVREQPERAAEVIQGRLDQLSGNMRKTLLAMQETLGGFAGLRG